MLASYALIMAGAVCVLVATLVGGFGAGWTFLPPLPFYPAGQWSTWSESLFFVGNLLVGTGFFVFCLDVLEQTTSRYGGLDANARLAVPARPRTGGAAAAGDRRHRRRDRRPALDGGRQRRSCSDCSGRTYDHTVGIDALVAKNLVYFFGHSIANLTIYLAAAAVYVLVPRYAGRPYETTKCSSPAGPARSSSSPPPTRTTCTWTSSSRSGPQVISEVASYGALIPVAVITIYSMTMLVWGSRYRWTLASTLLYVGLAGWAIGGTGAVIDSLIPINFRLHNTAWVVAHFHTYLILTVVVWALAFLAHLLERDADRTSSRAGRAWTIALILVGGYGLTGTWFVEGVLGVPRRYAIQPPGTSGYSLVGSIFALLLALGFLSLCLQLVPLARAAWERRHYVYAEHTDSWTGTHYQARGRRPAEAPLPRGAGGRRPAAREPGTARARGSPPASSGSPPSSRRSSTPPRRASATTTSTTPASSSSASCSACCSARCPSISRRLGERPTLGLAAVIAAPTLMMLADGAALLRAARAPPVRARPLPPRDGRLRPRHRPRRDPARPRHRPARRLPRVGMAIMFAAAMK